MKGLRATNGGGAPAAPSHTSDFVRRRRLPGTPLRKLRRRGPSRAGPQAFSPKPQACLPPASGHPLFQTRQAAQTVCAAEPPRPSPSLLLCPCAAPRAGPSPGSRPALLPPSSPSSCSASSLALPLLGTTWTLDQGTFSNCGSSTICLMILPLRLLFPFLRSLSSYSHSSFCPAAPHAQEVTFSLNSTGEFPASNCR